eukprot:2004129-Pyramimonas_sp.AAC.1
MLQSLQWQLHNIPEGVRALENVQQVLDRMIAFAMDSANHPTEMQEGMHRIFQELSRLRALLETFENFGETLGGIQTAIEGLTTTFA